MIFKWNDSQNTITNFIDLDNDGVYDLQSFYTVGELGSISGYIKGDTNSPMSGWKVCLDQNKNGTCEESSEKFTISDNGGFYKFSDGKNEFIIYYKFLIKTGAL